MPQSFITIRVACALLSLPLSYRKLTHHAINIPALLTRKTLINALFSEVSTGMFTQMTSTMT